MRKDINNRKLYSIIKLENLPLYVTGETPIFYPHELLIDNNLHEDEYSMFRNNRQRFESIKFYIEKNYMPILQEQKEFTIDNIFLFVSRIRNKQKERNGISSYRKESGNRSMATYKKDSDEITGWIFNRYSVDEELLKQLDKIDAKDKWADKIWRERGKPTFQKKIISGVRYGKGFVVTNNKRSFDKIIIRRYIGVRIKNNKIVISSPD